MAFMKRFYALSARASSSCGIASYSKNDSSGRQWWNKAEYSSSLVASCWYGGKTHEHIAFADNSVAVLRIEERDRRFYNLVFLERGVVKHERRQPFTGGIPN